MEFEIGAIVEGKVKSITNFGAFVELEGGKSGLVHISEISDTFVKDIKDHLQEGQTVKVKIISLDEKGKLGLSIKRVRNEKNDETKEFEKKESFNNNGYRKKDIADNGYKRLANLKNNGSNRFEDMMAKFKQVSDEKISSYTEKTKRRGNNKKSNHRNDM